MNIENFEDVTILIVDDSPVSLEEIFQFLSNAGFKVVMAEDGESAIAQAQDTNPDVILLDIIMPGIDGFETCRRFKGNPLTQDIPIIFMTALSQTSVVVKGFQLGAVDFIIKPIHQEIILARIISHLTIQKLQQSLQEQNLKLQREIQQRQKAEAALVKANIQLKNLATSDSLTQVANRRRFDEYLDQAWGISIREAWFISLLMCDVDFFKRYNDNWGHQAGDRCLYQVAQAIKRVIKRPADLVARYGGEEFAVILPHTPEDGAMMVAQLIRSSVRELSLIHPESPVSDYVTLSVGVTSTVPLRDSSPDILVAAADLAVYQAKELGRDRAVFVPVKK